MHRVLAHNTYNLPVVVSNENLLLIGLLVDVLVSNRKLTGGSQKLTVEKPSYHIESFLITKTYNVTWTKLQVRKL